MLLARQSPDAVPEVKQFETDHFYFKVTGDLLTVTPKGELDGNVIASVYSGLQRIFVPDSGFEVTKILTDARSVQALVLGPEDVERLSKMARRSPTGVKMPDGLKHAFVTNNPDHADIVQLVGLTMKRKGVNRTMKPFLNIEEAERWLEIGESRKADPKPDRSGSPG